MFSPVWFLMQATQVWSLSRGSPRERGIKQGWVGRATPQEPMPQLRLLGVGCARGRRLASLLDDFVRLPEQRRGHLQAERLRRLEVHDQLELRRLLYG